MVNESFFNLELPKEQRRRCHRDCTQEDIFSIHDNIDGNTEERTFLITDVFIFLVSSNVLSKHFIMLLVATVQLLMITFLITNSLYAGNFISLALKNQFDEMITVASYLFDASCV